MKLFIGVCILFYLVQCETTNESSLLNITVVVPESNILNVKDIVFEVDINQKDKSGVRNGYIIRLK